MALDENPYAAPRSIEAAAEETSAVHGPGRVTGWLALLCAGLVYVSPVVFVASMVKEYAETESKFDSVPGLLLTVILEIVLGSAFTAFGIVAGLRLKRIHRRAVPFAKMYLLAAVAHSFVSGFLPFALMSTMTAQGRAAVTALATQQASRTVVFATVWLLYLTYSKQVKTLFPS